jgi:hypothetical protein
MTSCQCTTRPYRCLLTALSFLDKSTAEHYTGACTFVPTYGLGSNRSHTGVMVQALVQSIVRSIIPFAESECGTWPLPASDGRPVDGLDVHDMLVSAAELVPGQVPVASRRLAELAAEPLLQAFKDGHVADGMNKRPVWEMCEECCDIVWAYGRLFGSQHTRAAALELGTRSLPHQCMPQFTCGLHHVYEQEHPGACDQDDTLTVCYSHGRAPQPHTSEAACVSENVIACVDSACAAVAALIRPNVHMVSPPASPRDLVRLLSGAPLQHLCAYICISTS